MAGDPNDLWAAIEAGDDRRIEQLLQADPALADARHDGTPAVRHSLYFGRRAAAERIAALATSLDAFDLASLGRADDLAAYVDANPDATRAFSNDGFTALHFAAFLGGADAARVLIEHGADVNAVARNPMHVQPLHSAAAGRTEVAELLVEAGADVNARQQGGYVPLHEAALNGNDALVELLLAHGADPAMREDEGRDAADHAERTGHPELAERLRAAAR
jgi:ankyrin repeat protein